MVEGESVYPSGDESPAIDRRMMLDLYSTRKFKFMHKPAVGQARGILVAWDSNVLEVIESVIGDYSVSVKCKNKEDDLVWAFSVVYGPCDHSEFGRLKEELCRARGLWQVPWCVGGILIQFGFRRKGWVLLG